MPGSAQTWKCLVNQYLLLLIIKRQSRAVSGTHISRVSADSLAGSLTLGLGLGDRKSPALPWRALGSGGGRRPAVTGRPQGTRSSPVPLQGAGPRAHWKGLRRSGASDGQTDQQGGGVSHRVRQASCSRPELEARVHVYSIARCFGKLCPATVDPIPSETRAEGVLGKGTTGLVQIRGWEGEGGTRMQAFPCSPRDASL